MTKIIDILLAWEAAEFIPVEDYPIIIRIYGGGASSHQTNHLMVAISSLNIDRTKYKLEVLYCDDVNMRHYSLKDVIDWLLASHVHFIAAHLHQGISLEVLSSQGINWDLGFIKRQISRLTYHPGWPNEEFLHCPVFLQDKYQYLKILGNWANPTFQFTRPKCESDMNSSLTQLET